MHCSPNLFIFSATPLKQITPGDHLISSPTIKVRIQNPRLNQKVRTRLNFDIMDSSAKRRGIAWGQDAEVLHQQLEHNSIYSISKFMANSVNKKYNSDPCEIQLTTTSIINALPQDDDFGKQSIVPISQAITSKELVTLKARITHIGEIMDSPNNKMRLRIIKLVDQSAIEAELCLFNEQFPLVHKL